MRFLLFFVLFFMPLAANALEIKGLQSEIFENGEHVSMRLSGRADFDIYPSEDPPPRIIVELDKARWAKPGLPKNYQGVIISRVRFVKNKGLVVFDLAGNARLDNVRLVHKKGYYVLQFDLLAKIKRQKAETAPKPSVASNSVKAHSSHRNNKPVIIIDAGHGGQDPGTEGYSGSHEKNLTLSYAKALKEALEDTGNYK